jgi:hypothetical protein
MNVERQATLRASSRTPYWRMTARWMSLSRGNGKPWVLAYWACEKGLSPLMGRIVAPRFRTSGSTLTRPPSSGVQMLPQS